MIPYAREAGAVVAVLAIAGLCWLSFDYGHGKGLAEREAEYNELRGEYVAQNVLWARERVKSAEAARELEHADAAAKYAAGEAYERGKTDAEAAAAGLVADLRAGTAQLRNHWQGCLATSELSQAAADAGSADGGARLRQEDLRAVLHIGGLCEAHVRGLQRVAP